MFQLIAAILPLLVAGSFLVLMKATNNGAQAPQGSAVAAPPPPSSSSSSEPAAAAVPSTPIADALSSPPSTIQSQEASSSSSSSPTSPKQQSSGTITLRFIQGEKPVRTHECDLNKPINALKNEVYASSLDGSAPSGGVRILWIKSGQMLKDDRTLHDYPTIKPDDVVHIHVLQMEGHEAPVADGLHQRNSSNIADANQHVMPQGEYLIPPGAPHALAPPIHLQPIPATALIFRTTFALYTSILGIMWGLVLVLGNRLFSLNALLCLIFLTGVMVVGLVQALFAPGENGARPIAAHGR